jgi:hypothetical protein
MKVTNGRTGHDLATEARKADTFWKRFRGLMGVRDLPHGTGLWIEPCNSVHCFGMKITIDVVFVSREGEVLHLIPAMRPGQVSKIVKGARAVLELPEGTIAASGTQVGDRLARG